MKEQNDFFWERRPQSLCKMCGKCCRIATTSTPYSELLKLAEEGHEGAINFLEIFEPYPSVEDAMLVDKTLVENIGYDENTTFYHCRYIQKNNLCGRYDIRKELCRHFPSSAFAIVPPNCGFKDWLKQEQEKIVQKVKDAKIERLAYQKELLKPTCTPEKQELLKKLITKLDAYIENYAKYGSHEW